MTSWARSGMGISLTPAVCWTGCTGFLGLISSSGETQAGSRKPVLLEIEDLPASLQTVPAAGHVDSLAESPSVAIGGIRYFAVSVRSPRGVRGSSLVVLYPETAWRQARREAAMPALLLGVASLAAMVLVTSLIAHRMSRRIRRVERHVAAIAAGEFQQLEPGDRRDEVADLVASINQMCVSARRHAADDRAVRTVPVDGPACDRTRSSTSQLAHRSSHEHPAAHETPAGPAR